MVVGGDAEVKYTLAHQPIVIVPIGGPGLRPDGTLRPRTGIDHKAHEHCTRDGGGLRPRERSERAVCC